MEPSSVSGTAVTKESLSVDSTADHTCLASSKGGAMDIQRAHGSDDETEFAKGSEMA